MNTSALSETAAYQSRLTTGYFGMGYDWNLFQGSPILFKLEDFSNGMSQDID